MRLQEMIPFLLPGTGNKRGSCSEHGPVGHTSPSSKMWSNQTLSKQLSIATPSSIVRKLGDGQKRGGGELRHLAL